ncbi:MAG: outer membrane protein assembly factor BamD [Myxococcota bacterium]
MRLHRAVSLLLIAAACAEDQAGELGYGASARQNYQMGMTELRDENYLEAVKYLQYVKNKFPFSKYAAYAELRIADTHFAEGKFLEAIDAYKLFERGHPTHPEVARGYVGYRVVRANVEQMPEDWFIIPPAYERDQAAARDALREARDFLERFPRSKYVKRVGGYLARIVGRLTEHEIYAANFYLSRGKPKAAAWRLEALLEQYPEARREGPALLLLGKTYLQMRDAPRAREIFARMVRERPGDYNSRKAELYLEFMDRERM